MTVVSEASDGLGIATSDLFESALQVGMSFKAQPEVYRRRACPEEIRNLLVGDLPEHGKPVAEVLAAFVQDVLPYCKNEASPRFLGFGDTGDDPAALVGSILATFTQQNLINQSFDSPSATFVEIAVLRWLRDLMGYMNSPVVDIATVGDVGGLVTHGGTVSNTESFPVAGGGAAATRRRSGDER